jgi:hypothetical protein
MGEMGMSRTWANTGRWLSILILLLAGLVHVAVDSVSECGAECVSYASCEGGEHHCEPGENPTRRVGAGADLLVSPAFEAPSPRMEASPAVVVCAPCAKPPWRGASGPWTQRVGLRLYA